MYCVPELWFTVNKVIGQVKKKLPEYQGEEKVFKDLVEMQQVETEFGKRLPQAQSNSCTLLIFQ